jgi:hypothetical protein
MDQRRRDNLYDTEAECGADPIRDDAPADEEQTDDRERQEQEPRRPAKSDEQTMRKPCTHGTAWVSRRVVYRLGVPARGIGGVISTQADTQEDDRQGEGDERRSSQHSLA